MRWGKLLVVEAAITGGWFVFTRTSDPVSQDARAHMPAIMAGLDREFATRHLCSRESPFPLQTGGGGCRPCEDLASAGPLERRKAPRFHGRAAALDPRAYPQGRRDLYTTAEDPLSGDKAPRFCFGRTRVHHIAAAQPHMVMGGTYALGVE